MATEQAIQQVRDEIEELRGYITLEHHDQADAMQRALDILTADAPATPDAVAALPGKWRDAAIEWYSDTSQTYTAEENASYAEAMKRCADELEVALKGE